MRAVIIAIVASGLAAGCGFKPKDFGRAPGLSEVGSGLKKQPPQIHLAGGEVDRGAEGSLWRTRGMDLFRDPRARNAGDSLTVKIAIKDKAKIDSTSTRTKEAKSNFNAEANYDVGLKGFTRAGNVNGDTNVESNSTHNGQGAVSRSETIELLVAAVVTSVLPNGQLVIKGTQEVRVNYELRILTVEGIVRPRDIAQDNSVSYEKIAEARISYGGRGRIMEVQQPNWGQQFFDLIMPY